MHWDRHPYPFDRSTQKCQGRKFTPDLMRWEETMLGADTSRNVTWAEFSGGGVRAQTAVRLQAFARCLIQVGSLAAGVAAKAGAYQRHQGSRQRAHGVNLLDCLREVDAIFLMQRRRGARVEMRADASLPRLNCDARGLRTSIWNLTQNAVEASRECGTVVVCAELVRVGLEHMVELRVSDRGVGMGPATLMRAFDPWFTTKPRQAQGLGLPMVERFIEEHGGQLCLQSEYGAGTIATLRLPITPEISRDARWADESGR